MTAAAPPALSDCDRALDAAAEAYRRARLDELARLRGLGIDCAERIGLAMSGRLGRAEVAALAGKDGLLPRFFRSERAVRQIVILEMELLGLRSAPDRDRPRYAEDAARETCAGARGGPDGGFREGGDYDNGPYDQVVARLRRDLRTEAPANDPFAPPPERSDRARQAPRRKPWRRAEPRPKAAPPPGMRRGKPAAIRKFVYGPVVTLRMALCAGGVVLPIPAQGLKARYLAGEIGAGEIGAGEIGRGRGPPG